MKTSKLFGSALLATLLCFSACEEIKQHVNPTPEEVKSEIIIDHDLITNGLSFTNAVGEKAVSFTTNEDWTLSIAATPSGETWCTASAASGTKGDATVKFSVIENSTYDDRSVSVTIKSGTASKTFTITQKCADAMLLTTTKYEVGQDGGTIEIEVKSNVDYEMEISKSARGWITETRTRALTAYKHTLNIVANEEVEKREGEIYFKSGEKIETVKVYQTGGAILMLSKNEYIVSALGENITVDIKSNIEYGVHMPDVDWITEEVTTRGMSSHTLNYIIAPNEGYESRSAEIVFYDKNSDLKNILKVNQSPKGAIVISKKSYELAAEGGIIEVELTSNIEFEITMPDVDWIEIVNTRAMQQHTLYFKVAENLGIMDRNVNIIFSDKESLLRDTISVKQLNCSGYHRFYSDTKGTYGTIELYKAGALKSILELYKKLDVDTYLSKLTISGPINGDDIKVLNKVYSSIDSFKIDLSDAIIVEGGGSYYYYSFKDYFTKNDEIGSYMFANSNAKILTLPKSATTISDYAFSNSGLFTLITGNGVTSISDHAFSGANFLRNIYIGEGVTSISDASVFLECSALDVLDISVGGIAIADYAFDKIPVTHVHISNGVATIGRGAFRSCENLKTVTIGDGVTSISDDAFDGCRTLSSITMGKSVVSIGDCAFYDCVFLTSIDIPSSVTNIGDLAFYRTAISYVDIPNSVTNIGNYAFSKTSLISAVIPNSVTDIGDYTFKNCSKLTRLYCKAVVPPTGGDMIDLGVYVYVPHQSVEAYKASDNWKQYSDYIVGYDYEQNDEVDFDLSKCQVGDFIKYKGVNCVVFYAEEDAIKLVSATCARREWGLSGQSIGTYDEKDGSVNAAIAKSKGLFDSLPAFAWCESLGDGWYLPSSGELGQIAINRSNINSSLLNMNCTPLMGSNYWSSTEDSRGYAYSVDFPYYTYSAVKCICSKIGENSVRAVTTVKK